MRATTAGMGLVLAACVPALASAGDLELALFAGRSFPTYEQSFQYDAGSFAASGAGVAVRQEGAFSITAKGSLAAGVALAFFPTPSLGLEARVDSLGVAATASGVRFTASVSLPAPFPSYSTSVDLSPGDVSVDRITPVSFGLKLRTPGRFRVFVAGGASYLPSLRATITESLGAGTTDRLLTSLGVATLAVRAQADPSEGQGRWGWNAGLGFEVAVAKRVALHAEGRFYRFPKQTLTWQVASSGPLSSIEQAIQAIAQTRLDPVVFDPTFFQASAGIAVRF